MTSLRRFLRLLFERRVQYRVALAGLLFLATMALTFAGAFLSGNNLLFLIFAAMLALLLVSGFLNRLVLAGLELELLVPEHVSARTPTEARVRLRNLKRFTPSFSIELGAPALKSSVYFPLIPGHSTLEAPVEIVFPRRGRHTENTFLIATKFPFGFIRRTSKVEMRRETIVCPSLAGDAATALLLDAIESETGGSQRGSSRELHRIRPYEAGDPARHVDWKSTARTGALQTREFARDERPPVEIVLETAIEPGEEERFEIAVEQCAFAAWSLAASGNPVAFESEKTSIFASNQNDIYDILIWLALVKPVVAPAEAGADHDPNSQHLRIVFRAGLTTGAVE
jgi:uncharacterized protein (DUF58 family)